MLPAIPDRSRPPAKPDEPGLTSLVATTVATAAVLGVVVGLIAQSLILGVLFAILGGGVRLGVAAWQRIRALPTDTVDPWALPRPWRGLVEQALDAGKRFHAAAEAWPPGPLRDRLASLEPAVEGEVRAVWVAAQQGATLSGGYPVGSKRPTPADLSAELEAVQRERSDLAPGDHAKREELDRAEQSLAAQLQAARRAESTSRGVEGRLRGLVARLDEAVTSVVALTAAPGGAGDIEGAASIIAGLGQEIAALQAGMGEAAQLPSGSERPTGVDRASGPAGTPIAGPPSTPPTS
jgi:hypothetical protein